MKITVLAGMGQSSFILINRLIDAGYRDLDIILENHPSRAKMLRNRVRRLGWVTTISQLVFMVTIVPFLKWRGQKRVDEIITEHGLRIEPPDPSICCHVETVNSDDVINRLVSQNPDLVIVNGTRIIQASVLEAIPAPFVNTHAGITPQYRGVHGGYWALWNRDAANFGVTIHLVDTGVDTGAVLFQTRPSPAGQDNFATYPVLQQAVSLSGLLGLLENLEAGRRFIPLSVSDVPSAQWFHPTIFQYLAGRMRGVK